MNIRSLFQSSHRRMDANLDAYLDGALALREVERFEAHLATCDACTSAVADGQRLKSLYATLPELPAPRSFALTESMLVPRPATAESRPAGWNSLLRGFQGTAAAGVALLAVLVVADVTGGTTATDSDDESGFHTTGLEAAGDGADDPEITSSSTEASPATDSAGPPGDVAEPEGDGDNDGAEGYEPPDATATSGVGAAGSHRPTPEPDSEGHRNTGDDDDDDGVPAAPGQAEIAGADDGDAFTAETQLAADTSGGDSGLDPLRIAQIIAAGLAVAAVAGYGITRRLAPARNR